MISIQSSLTRIIKTFFYKNKTKYKKKKDKKKDEKIKNKKL